MKMGLTGIGMLLLALGGGPVGHAADVGPDAEAAFSKLKALAGDWQSDDGRETLTYEVVAGGTAVLERETSTEHPTMMTLYHRDGDRLMLTHYCMAGNQPRMVARSFDAATGELAFEFLDATNLPSPAAGHMHDAKIRFIDDNHIAAEWQFYSDGRAAMTERARYARVR